jgi:hypothetical protein
MKYGLTFAVSLLILLFGLWGIFTPGVPKGNSRRPLTQASYQKTESPHQKYITKNIEDIQVGDLVYATDPETGETVKCPVTQVFVNHAEGIHHLSVSDGTSTQTFGVTAEHPYFVVGTDENLAELFDRAVGFSNSQDEEPEIVFAIEDKQGNEQTGCYVAAKDLRTDDLLIVMIPRRRRIERSKPLQPVFIVFMQTRLIVIDKNRRRNMHRIDQHKTFLNAAFLNGFLHLRRDVHKIHATGNIERNHFAVSFHVSLRLLFYSNAYHQTMAENSSPQNQEEFLPCH